MSREPYPTDEPAVVTAGLPYANGDLHLGHLRSIIAADIYARALRRLGQDAPYVCGSDMHGTPIAVEAEQAGIDPETLALDHHEQHRETFEQFEVDFAHYGHTREDANLNLTQSIVETLEDEGYIVEKEIEVAWDPQEGQPLPDRYVQGTCPYCGAQARGDECDDGCGRHLEPGEIEDPTSTITGNPAEYRRRRHKFFRLSDLQEYLQGFIDRLEGTPNARNQPREWIEGELEDWCITRDLDWGVEYPGEPPDGQDQLVLYVWVDAPTGYITFTRDYSEEVGTDQYDWESVWREDGEIIHFIGVDIIQHHTVFWPAMLHGAGFNEPRAVAACGYVTLRGEGFSKSRNRAVWAREYLESDLDPALVRHYLTVANTFQQELDFSWARFAERVNADLADTIGNFVYRSLLFAHRNYDGTPSTDIPAEVREEIEAALEEYREAVNTYDIRALGEVPVELARFGNEYIQRHEPWQLVDEAPEEAAAVIRGCVQLATAVALLIQPIAPVQAARIWNRVGPTDDIEEAELDAALVSPPDAFGAPVEPFARVEDETVETLVERLDDRVAASDTDADQSAAADVEPLEGERISFDTFQNLDLRVGQVEFAEPVEGADDLLRLEVDIGVETRQVVAGLRGLHDTDALEGQRVILVANMESTELFGLESNGMILAAGEDADLLTTVGDSPLGTRIR
ncbi:MAG: methionine--tRNA ligase [Halobacteriaceae archaeon]